MKRLSRDRAGARTGHRPRHDLPAGTALLPQIKHIVVLMMENHSYDNYLGMLQNRGEGFPLDSDGKPDVSNTGADGEVIRPFHLPARTFPLADRWFSSCLGPTFPNRRFLIAGTAHGLIDDSSYDLLDYPPAGTIFDMLTEHGISWANYHPVPQDQSRWKHYTRHRRKTITRRLRSAAQKVPAVTQGVHKDIQFTAAVFPLGIGRY